MIFSIFRLVSQQDSSQPKQYTRSLPFPFHYHIEANTQTIYRNSKDDWPKLTSLANTA